MTEEELLEFGEAYYQAGRLAGISLERARAKPLNDAVADVCTYPGCTEGTATFETLPKGLGPRIKDLQKAWEAYARKENQK